MSLEKLQQEADSLESLDIDNLSPEQLEQLVEKFNNILNSQEIFLEEIKSQLEDIETENNETDNL
jgi:hypothetical protein